ncbi:hypothetical protein BJ508DRAFT_326124 [Ascobolus immersus RN42]|uniref:Uncharacterized protein n=1 Tax=Ascobolus immersus RN42 TaxID=1160509 RepID=A0A3N4IBX8_ASCIM|nr:hypothetical protein BJ508DRAFT_326124 [Ascobolus immersus RN42]
MSRRQSSSRTNPRSTLGRRTSLTQTPKKRQRTGSDEDPESGDSRRTTPQSSQDHTPSRRTIPASDSPSANGIPRTPSRSSSNTVNRLHGLSNSSQSSPITSSVSSPLAHTIQRRSSWLLSNDDKSLSNSGGSFTGIRLFQNEADPLQQTPVMKAPGIWENSGAFAEPIPTLLPSPIFNNNAHSNRTIPLGEFLSRQTDSLRSPPKPGAFDISELLKALNVDGQAAHRQRQDLSSDSDTDDRIQPPLVRHAELRNNDDDSDNEEELSETPEATTTKQQEKQEARRKKEEKKKAIEDGTFIPEVFLHDKGGDPELAKKLTKTVTAMFLWSQDHNISLSAYNDLIEVIQKEWFNAQELPKSYTTMKSMRKHLPLLPVYSADVPVMDKKGDSSTKHFTTAYFHSAKDVVQSQLRNPEVLKTLHRGLGIDADISTESHHGQGHKESIKASIEDFPVRPSAVSDAMVYAGSCLMLALKHGWIPVRVTGVFHNERTMDNAFFPEFKKKKWVTVNPILIREMEYRYLRINPIPRDSNEPIDFDFTENVTHEGENGGENETRDVRGLLVLHEYRIPVSCLGPQVRVNIYRDSREDGKFKSHLGPGIEQKCVHPAVNHVREMIIPERGSTPDPLRLLELWKEHEHWQAVNKAAAALQTQPARPSVGTFASSSNVDKDGFVVPGTPASKLPKSTATDKDQHPPIPPRLVKQRRLERARNKIVFSFEDKFVSTRHLRKTIAEDEIESGEISLSEIFFDQDPDATPDNEPIQNTCQPQHEERNPSGPTGTPGIPSEDMMDLDPSPTERDTLMSDIGEEQRNGNTNNQNFRKKRKRKRMCITIDFYTDKFGIFRTTHRNSGEGFEMDIEGEPYTVNASKIKSLRQRWDYRDQMTGKTQAFMKTKGLKKRESILTRFGPSINPFIQVSLDISHSEQKGIGELLLAYLADHFFSKDGSKEYTRVLRSYTFPPEVSRKPNFAYHVKHLKMSEVTCLIACMPFMLQRMDEQTIKIFKPATITKMNTFRGPGKVKLDQTSLKNLLIKTFLAVAKANSLVFARHIDTTLDEELNDGFMRMEHALIESRKLIFELVAPLEAARKKTIEDENLEVDEGYQALEELLIRQLEANLSDTSDTDSTSASASSASSRTSNTSKGKSGHGKGRPRKRKPKKLPASVSRLPNYHNAGHIVSNARCFGSGLNCSCSVGEIVHRVWKDLVQHTNYVDLDLVFCRHSNTMNGVRQVTAPLFLNTIADLRLTEINYTQILDNSYPNHPWKATLDELRDEIPSLCTGFFWGQMARCSKEDGTCSNKRGPGSALNLHHEDRFPDIKMGALIGRFKAMDILYPTNLSNLDPDDKVVQDLQRAYERDYGFKGQRIPVDLGFQTGGELKWWEWITIFDTDQGCKLSYRPGMVVPVDELIIDAENPNDQAEPEEVTSFAEIIGIFTHKNPLTGKDYVFFNIRWLGPLDEPDEETGLSRYKIQPKRRPSPDDVDNLPEFEKNMESWHNYIGLPSISASHFPYFVKDPWTHDEYIRNDYYFKSI